MTASRFAGGLLHNVVKHTRARDARNTALTVNPTKDPEPYSKLVRKKQSKESVEPVNPTKDPEPLNHAELNRLVTVESLSHRHCKA